MMTLLDLGKNIKDIRKQIEISQEQLAKQSSISKATLSKIKNGYIVNTSIVTINHILSLLRYELDIKIFNPFITQGGYNCNSASYNSSPAITSRFT
jgi:transcriptional regulator with XRE-family HTH domain